VRFLLAALFLLPAAGDWRNIAEGRRIPTSSYADQPYIVKMDDGAWLLCVTTGAGAEGAPGQHVITMRSTDQGRTWSAPVAVEPPDGPEASYAVMLKAGARVCIFYNHNTDNVRQAKADNPPYDTGFVTRVDSLGHFVFKYSDDGGRTWSPRRYEIPQRDFEIDLKNAYGGALKFFWNVGRAFPHAGAGYVPLHKVGGFGEGFFTSSEGVLLRSDNILTELDPERIRWETLPEGAAGLRTPAGGGPIAEEQSFAELSDGGLFAVYRTIDGHPAHSYSRDGGRNWSPPEYMQFGNGRLMKHPRAANFVWRLANGKYLYWFHNHGGRFIREHPRRRSIAYDDRNPVWVSAGEESAGPHGRVIRWGEPEILLYDDDPIVRMSYPDLIEDGGRTYVTETQKNVARVHEIDAEFLRLLFNPGLAAARRGLLLEWKRGGAGPLLPELPAFAKRSNRPDHGRDDTRAGVTFETWLRLSNLDGGQVLVDTRTAEGKGFALLTAEGGALETLLSDGRTAHRWVSEPGLLHAGGAQQVAIVLDGGPKVILVVVDGRLSDGGEARQFGWGRFSPHLLSVNGERTPRLGPPVLALRVYGRALMTAELGANFRARE
jgi:hypothetical protein